MSSDTLPCCLVRALVAFGLLLLPISYAHGQAPARLRFDPSPAVPRPGEPFQLRITAEDSSGQVATTFDEPASLFAFTSSPGPLLISEISGDGETIELTNASAAPLDVAGWEIESAHVGVDQKPLMRLRWPAGTVIPPGGVFTWSSHADSPGVYPGFGSSRRFNAAGTNLAGLHLLDASGQVVDAVRLGGPVPAFDRARWIGASLGRPGTSALSLQRVGNFNSFSAFDWSTNPPSLGAPNPGLTLPWASPTRRLPVTPARVPFAGGQWEGNAFFPANTTNSVATLAIQTADGRIFSSAPIRIAPFPPLDLSVPAAALRANESAPGPLGEGLVRIPEPHTSPVTVSLHLASTGDFEVPSTITIPAGATEIHFPVSSLDDRVADGRARVVLEASAPGYAAGHATLIQDDDESGELYIGLPASVGEGTGWFAGTGRVYLRESPFHDVEVSLTTDRLLEAPAVVIIPAGSTSASFPIRALDDDRRSRNLRPAFVRASMPPWPAAEGTVVFMDDDWQPDRLELPEGIVEGQTATARFVLGSVRDFDTEIEISSSLPRIAVPDRLRVAAGQREVAFPLVVPQNRILDGPSTARICAGTAEDGQDCRDCAVFDDEIEVSGAESTVPAALFADQPEPIEIRLTDRLHSTPRTNVPAIATLDSWSRPATLVPEPLPLLLSNGVFRGSITVAGSSLGATLRVEGPGFAHTTGPLAVLPGRRIPGPFSDLAISTMPPGLLALAGGSTEAARQLVELDPGTGTTLRSLALPRVVRRLAVSDSGRTAWCSSDDGTLLRIDVPAWQVTSETRVAPVGSPAKPEGLLVLAGTEDRLLVALDTNQPPRLGSFQMAVVADGVRQPRTLGIARGPVPGFLVPGRTADEAFVDWGGILLRLMLQPDGIASREFVVVGLSGNGVQPNLARLGDRLIRGTGATFAPSPISRLTSLQLGVAVASSADGRHLGHLGLDGTFSLADAMSGSVLAQHPVPWTSSVSTQAPPRFAAMSDGAFAALLPDRSAIHVWRTPLLDARSADLAVLARGPESMPATEALDAAGSLGVHTDWTWTVTNRGPDVAHRVEVVLDSGARFTIPSLPAGTSRSFPDPRLQSYPGVVRGTARASSVTPDPNPADNAASLRTELVLPALASVRQRALGVQDMAPSPDRRVLWLAVDAPSSDGGPGLLRLDPESGSVERVSSADEPVTRVRAAANGGTVLFQVGMSRVVRWNVPERRAEMTLSLAGETILDFAPLPGEERSLALATSARVAVFDDDLPRPAQIAEPRTARRLGIARGRLWVAETDRLHSCLLSRDGISRASDPTFLFLGEEPPAFHLDERSLYFEGRVVDITDSGAVGDVRFPPVAGPILPGPGNEGLYVAPPGQLARLDSRTLELRRSQSLPTAQRDVLRPRVIARWGTDGIAVLQHSNALWLIRSAVVPAPEQGNLSLALKQTPPGLVPDPYSWTLTITNHSDQVAPRTQLEIQGTVDADGLRATEASWVKYGNLHLRDLGDVPPHASLSIEIPGNRESSSLDLRATVTSAGVLDDPVDNQVTTAQERGYRDPDLAVFLPTASAPPVAGEPFVVRLVITNLTAHPALYPGLRIQPSLGLELISTSPWPLADFSPNYPELSVALPRTIPPAGRWELEVLVRSQDPGLVHITAQAEAQGRDLTPTNNRASRLISVPVAAQAPAATQAWALPEGPLRWSESRSEWLAAFDGHPAVAILSPDLRDVRREVAVPDLGIGPAELTVAEDGRTAWVLGSNRQIVAVNPDEASLPKRFDCPVCESGPGAFVELAAVPGSPDTLVAGALFGDAITPEVRIMAFRNGQPLPREFRGSSQGRDAVSLARAPDGRMWMATGTHLSEFRVDAGGIVPLRNLEGHGPLYGAISYAADRLVSGGGRILELTSLAIIAPAPNTEAYVASSESGRIFRFAAFDSPNVPRLHRLVEALDPKSLAVLQRWDDPSYSDFDRSRGYLLPQGSVGLWALRQRAFQIQSSGFNNATADLALTLSVPPFPSTIGTTIPATVILRHDGPHLARNARLAWETSGPLEFIDQAHPNPASQGVLPLGDLLPTNRTVSISLRLVGIGSSSLRLRVLSDIPDPVPDNDVVTWTHRTDPLPTVLLGDAVLIEGSLTDNASILSVPLSGPAPEYVTIPFRITPLTGQSSDLTADTGFLGAPQGARVLTAYILANDSVSEPDETFRLELLPSAYPYLRPSALLTVRDDDPVRLSASSPLIPEGNSGTSPATVALSLSRPLEFPLDVDYLVRSDTASPGVDFVPTSGTLRFAPGETTRSISFLVLGDTDFEPPETVLIQPSIRDARIPVVLEPGRPTLRNDDPAPPPSILGLARESNQWRVRFSTVAGSVYRLEFQDGTLRRAWLPAGLAPLTGNGQPASFLVPGSPVAARFFRIRTD